MIARAAASRMKCRCACARLDWVGLHWTLITLLFVCCVLVWSPMHLFNVQDMDMRGLMLSYMLDAGL